MTTAVRTPKRTTLPFGLCSVHTDTTFMSGSHLDDGFGESQRRRKVAYAKARAAGVSPNGKRYCPSLAKEAGDPRAWIDSKADVRRICREDGKGCEDLGVPLPEAEHVEKPYAVANDIVEQEVNQIVAKEAQGHIGTKERADLKEKTKARLKGSLT